MKGKILAVGIALCMLFSVACGCGGGQIETGAENGNISGQPGTGGSQGEEKNPGGGQGEEQTPGGEENYRTVVASQNTIGCGGYGAVFNAQIDPFNGDYFAATCDMGGVYFSYDKGESWTRHNIDGTLYTLEYDVTSEGVVWFAGSGLYKSTDHGRTYKMVLPKESEIVTSGNNYENINKWLYTDKVSDYAPHYQIFSIAVNRKSGGKEVYCAQRVSSSGLGYNSCIRIYGTKNGEDFSLFCELDYSYNFKLEFDESRNSLVCATPEKIYEIDAQKRVTTIDQPVKVQFSSGNNISFDSYYDAANDKNTFVFSAPDDGEHCAAACYKTNDLQDKASYINLTDELVSLTTEDFGLDSLADYNKGLNSYEYCEWIDGAVKQQFKWTIQDVFAHNDDVIYLYHEATTPTYKKDGSLYINRRTMIYLKYDAKKPEGERFSWVYGFPLKSYNTYIENRSWQDADSDFNFGMTTFPSNENALLYCSNVGIYYTEDGKTVKQLYSKVFGKDELEFTDGVNAAKKKLTRVNTTGIDVVCTQTVATDPFDSNHILMGCTDIGLLISYDNTQSWYHSLNEWQGDKLVDISYYKYTNTCFELHFDKERKGVVYGIWSEAKTAPYAPAAIYLTGESRFGISYDGGLSWTMKKITPDGKCLPYRMQVVYEGSARKIYIATESHGFFVTGDLGETFTAMNDGLKTATLGGKTAIFGNDILVCDSGIFAITGGTATSAEAGHGFYKWNEKANKFEEIALPATATEKGELLPAAVRDIEYDKKNDCIYLACTANVVTNYSKLQKCAGGILKYKDGKFTQIYDDKISVFAVNVDGSGTLYATELNGRVARFENGNSSYGILIDGLFHSLKKVCFGATDDILYVPTWGGNTERLILKREAC